MSFINVLFKRVTTAIRGTEAIEDGKILLDYERPSIYVDNGSTRVELTPRDTTLSTTSTNAIANNALTNSIINTTAEVSAITADNIPCGTKPVKELITSLESFICNGVVHNSIYRGKYLGTSVTAEQYAAISAGTFKDLYIGDYWTMVGVNYRIAAFDYYWNCGDNAIPPHHAVIVPDTCLYNAPMNNSNITTGGYVGSQMRTTNIGQAKTAIKAAFSGHVVNHRIYLVNAVANGYSSGGAWVDSEVDLMNEQMVYGSGIFSPVSTGSAVPANYRLEKTQLPLFAMNPATLNTRENYWLRDVITASTFALVSNYGAAHTTSASYPNGVRPAFCIS